MTSRLVPCVMLSVMCQLSLAVLLNEDQWVDVSRCRAKCYNQLLQPPVTDAKCTADKACDLCLKLCERQTVMEWNSLCTPSSEALCPSGCRTACAYIKDAASNESHPIEQLTFPQSPVIREASDDLLLVGWKPVQLIGSSIDQSETVLYSLFWRDASRHDWGHVLSTTNQVARVEGPHKSFFSLEFKLVAIIENGILAVTYPAYPPLQHAEADDELFVGADYDYQYYYYYDEDDTISDPLRSLTDNTAPKDHTPREDFQDGSNSKDLELPLDLNIRIHIISVWNSSLKANVTWSQPPSQWQPTFTLHVTRILCKVIINGSDVNCDLEPQIMETDVYARENQSLAVVSSITYNSRYLISLEAAGRRSQYLHFITPKCHVVTQDMTTCLQLSEMDQRHRVASSDVISGALPARPVFSLSLRDIVSYVCGVIMLCIVISVFCIGCKNHKLHKKIQGSVKAGRSSFRGRHRTEPESCDLTHSLEKPLFRGPRYLAEPLFDEDLYPLPEDYPNSLSTSSSSILPHPARVILRRSSLSLDEASLPSYSSQLIHGDHHFSSNHPHRFFGDLV